MISKYFTIAVKDKDGFVLPFLQGNSRVPVLYETEESAKAELDYINRTYQQKLDYVGRDDGIIARWIRTTREEPQYTEDEKKEMRWFMANASVKGVSLHS